VVDLLIAGQAEAGARQFVETIALGPGAWDQLPASMHETFVRNAPTWLDEARDSEALAIDLGPLERFTAPALLTVGSQSPPFFPMVMDRVARALPHAVRHTFASAGHAPHVTHPDDYVDVVASFAAV
jgi:pimeloyl-ACP methyl ester carboxylesterase